MSATAIHPLAADYLRRLRHAARHLPAARRDELCAEIENHLTEAIPPGASDAEALSVLERLGSPEEIVEAEQPPPETAARDPRTWREWAAIVLLPFGGFLFGVGWVVGLILLLSSRAWTVRDKVIGALIFPGGIAIGVPLLLLSGAPQTHLCSTTLGGQTHCVTSGGPSTLQEVIGYVVAVIVILGPILTAIHLARRARPAG